MGRQDYGYYTPKTDSHKEENLKSMSSKQVIVNGMQFYKMLQFVRKGVMPSS